MTKFGYFCVVLSICLNFDPRLVEGKKAERVVCYYTNWSAYRQGPAKFLPDNINPYLCTHLIYAFGGLTADSGIKPFDKYQDIDKGGYSKFNGLKTYNKGLKTLIAVGGWNEGSGRFSRLVSETESRRSFIKNTIRFLRQYQFDGLDLDWEYPAAREGGEAADKKNYAIFIKELREAFEDESKSSGRTRLLLTIAVPAGIEWIQKGFDVASINRNVDFFNLLTYDFHASTEPAVNHHAPLRAKEGISDYDYKSQLNIEYAINYYLEEGADAEKLVVGLPTYGRSYTLFNPESTDIGAPASGPGTKGKYTKEPGYLAYYEICEGIKAGEWDVENIGSDAQGPHAVKDDQWVGYDDTRIMAVKAKWVRDKGLGGIMFWSIETDDFRGFCHGKPFPLIEAAKIAYYTGESPELSKSSSKKNEIRRTTTTTPSPPPTTTQKPNTNSRKKGKKGSRTSTTTEEPETSRNNRRRKNKKVTTTPTPPVTQDPLRTPPPPTTPESSVEFECKDDGFFPHPKDCKKYFWCLDAPGLGLVAHHFTCPAGLFFNKNTDSCDYSRNVPCKPGGAATTTTTTTTTTTPKPKTSTQKPEDDDEEYEYYDDEDEEEVKSEKAIEKVKEKEKDKNKSSSKKSAQEVKDIRNLLSIIRKLGGVEELEKYLEANPDLAENVEEYEYEEEDDKISSTTSKPSTFPPRNRFTPPSQSGESKKLPSSPRTYASISREKNSKKIDSPSSTTNKNAQNTQKNTQITQSSNSNNDEEDEDEEVKSKTVTSSSRPKYVSLNRDKYTSSTAPSSSTLTSIVVRYSNEDKLIEEKPISYVTSRPYSKVTGTETPKPKYVTLSRFKFSTTTPSTESQEESKKDENVTKLDKDKNQEPEYLNTEEEEEYEDEEGVENSPSTSTSTTTSTTTTTIKPRIRIPSRFNPSSSSTSPPFSTRNLGRSRISTSSTSTTTTPPPLVTTARNNRGSFNPANRRNLLERRRTTERPKQEEEEGEESNPESEVVTQKNPELRRTRTRATSPEPPSKNSNVQRTRFRSTILLTSTPSTQLIPLGGSFNSAVVRRRTRKPPISSNNSQNSQIYSSTTSTTSTTIAPLTTSTLRTTTILPQINKIVPIPDSQDYYYYVYEDEDILDKSQSKIVPNPQSINKRVLEVHDEEKSGVDKFAKKLKEERKLNKNGKNSKNNLVNLGISQLSDKVKINESGALECLDLGIFPHPFSCKSYVHCSISSNGKGLRAWVYNCPKELQFDAVGAMCNWAAENSPNCT